jgi:hypothetical protein
VDKLSIQLSMLLAASTLAGCSLIGVRPPENVTYEPATPLPTPTCRGPEFLVTISQVRVSGGTASIDVNPGQSPVSRTGSSLRWRLDDDRYSFASDGITFVKANHPEQPASGPSRSGRGRDGREFVVCFDDTTSVGVTEWHYSVKFYERKAPLATTRIVWICDPTVVNSDTWKSLNQAVDCNAAPP